MNLEQLIGSYTTGKSWDEMLESKVIRAPYQALMTSMGQMPLDELLRKEQYASELFMNQGITFTVYSDNAGIERIFPFDIIPRIITTLEWEQVTRGIKQRLKALNLFLNDIYHEQNILKEKIIPASLIASCPHFTREVYGINVPHDIYVHVSGIDLIRGEDKAFYVLEDNLRTPSGVSYMLENREVTKRIFPSLLTENKVSMVGNYPLLLHANLIALSPRQTNNPIAVILTPGVFNSAYYEHTFLARQMGIPLVEGSDLLVDNHKVFMKTTHGLVQVDVIYRRVDDDFLDPITFNSGSMLGVPGLVGAYRKGNVAIANALGNGVADDKAVYAYVPQMIKYYLNEDPILPNIPTYHLENQEIRDHVFKNIHQMVLKRTNQSGGYGMLMGNKTTDEEVNAFKKAVEENPREFIAQPIIQLSTVPCLIDGKLVARHVDLRPYALCGPSGIEIVPGGLTRVALREGSMVVNSSQGGGSKDTWIIN